MRASHKPLLARTMWPSAVAIGLRQNASSDRTFGTRDYSAANGRGRRPAIPRARRAEGPTSRPAFSAHGRRETSQVLSGYHIEMSAASKSNPQDGDATLA